MARLASGTRKRPDGTLEKRFTINGERYSVYGKNAKELTAKEQEARKLIAAGLYTSNRKLTLDQYFEEWLKHKRGGTKGNTLKTYKSHYYKHISPELGKRKVQDLERREILKLQNKWTEKMAISTCNAMLKTLKIILQDAVHDEIINRSPAQSVKVLKDTGEKATETYHRALTEQEQADFMEEVKNHFYYEFIALLLATGMRQGEAAALLWSDIDYNKNVIRIRSTVSFDEDGHLIIGDSPKSDAGVREIPMNDTIKEILKAQKKKNLLFQYTNVVDINQRVFSSVYGSIVTDQAINRAIKDTLTDLEVKNIHIEHFTAHALRDTFATRYIEQGGNMHTLKNIMGHSSLAMTMDLYAHVLPNTKQKEMDNLTIVI